MKRWLSFAGRASRREYWARTVVAMAVFFSSGVLLLVLAVLALLALETVIYIWAVLAVSVRRLHDLGFSGPAGFRSTSASVRACFARGTVGPNEFGPDPLG